MQRDKRIGLALAILLIGFATAFCFRPDMGDMLQSPQLENPQAIDSQMAEQSNVPYLTDLEEVVPDVVAEKNSDTNSLVSGKEPNSTSETHWEPFSFSEDETIDELLGDGSENSENHDRRDVPYEPEDRLASSPLAAPDPITEESALEREEDDLEITYEEDDEDSVWKSVSDSNLADSDHEEDLLSDSDSVFEELPVQNLKKNSNYSRIHVVQSGDMLSTISRKYLGSSARYKEIYEINRDILSSPHDLQVGMKLKIPPRNLENLPVAGKSRKKRVASETGRKIPRSSSSRSSRMTNSGSEKHSAKSLSEQGSITRNTQEKFAPLKRKLTQRKYKRSTTYLDELISDHPENFTRKKTTDYKVVRNKDDPEVEQE